MKDFAGKTAVITGGGTGMGRELAKQLVAEGCNVAMCDVSAETMAETKKLALKGAPQGTRVSTHIADVSIEDQVLKFRDGVKRELDTDHIHLLFNNAGIGGGPSFITSSREEWEKTFNVCWYGVYYSCRAFMPMLLKANEAHIVNTSSVNGFWASLGPNRAHTAYPAAKFAVKGFTEALITDLRLNAPHVKCSVVMPGHIGTQIIENTRKVLSGHSSGEMSAAEVADTRRSIKAMGFPADQMSDEQIRQFVA
jgi:NAD(P)-dependent dehydrogenase (short-subunit alcohol dehydrogenase family)